MTGEIVEALRNGMFRIQLDNGHETLGYTAGKMRRFRIRMNPGDRVRLGLSASALGGGGIVSRMRPGDERPEWSRHAPAPLLDARRIPDRAGQWTAGRGRSERGPEHRR